MVKIKTKGWNKMSNIQMFNDYTNQIYTYGLKRGFVIGIIGMTIGTIGCNELWKNRGKIKTYIDTKISKFKKG